MDIVTLMIAGSMVIMGPVEIPETAPENAVAQIIFENTSTNSELDNKEHLLSLEGFDVFVRFHFNSGVGGADSIIVTPPIGWTCDPVDCRLELLEGYSGIMFLMPWEGM